MDYSVILATTKDLLRNPINGLGKLLAPADRATIFDRWSSDSSLSRDWDSRTRKIAEMIPEEASVIEFGAGREVLKGCLKASSVYQPSDIVARSPTTLVADLNDPKFELHAAYSHAVFSGVLEYVFNIDAIVAKIRYSVPCIVTSYAVTDLTPSIVQRKHNGWVNNYSEAQLVAIFQRHGYRLGTSDSWYDQKIFVFYLS